MASRHRFYRNSSSTSSYSLRGPERPSVLFLVEGNSEALFLETWLGSSGRNSDDIAVISYNGGQPDAFLKRFVGDDNFPSVKKLGFFLDAEEKTVADKERMISESLVRHGIIPTGNKIKAGALYEDAKLKIALFVSPDNGGAGFIENIVVAEIDDSPIAKCIEAFQACVTSIVGKPIHEKSVVQAFIGVHKRGLCGTGRGFEAGVLNVMSHAYVDIRNTFNQLLDSE